MKPYHVLFQQPRTVIIVLSTGYWSLNSAWPSSGWYVIFFTTAAPASIRLPDEKSCIACTQASVLTLDWHMSVTQDFSFLSTSLDTHFLCFSVFTRRLDMANHKEVLLQLPSKYKTIRVRTYSEMFFLHATEQEYMSGRPSIVSLHASSIRRRVTLWVWRTIE